MSPKEIRKVSIDELRREVEKLLNQNSNILTDTEKKYISDSLSGDFEDISFSLSIIKDATSRKTERELISKSYVKTGGNVSTKVWNIFRKLTELDSNLLNELKYDSEKIVTLLREVSSENLNNSELFSILQDRLYKLLNDKEVTNETPTTSF